MTKFVDNTGIGRCVEHINTLLNGKAGYKSKELKPRILGDMAVYTMAAACYGGSITQIVLTSTSSTTVSSATLVTDRISGFTTVHEKPLTITPTICK